ncbi:MULTISPECIES: hypothetical protein [Tenacibaculum]|uniref:hypothetical protein n=1 Tax=Tenacibaculum TaxID=104267 RepID=UPI001F0A314B|nr:MULTISPECIES: hypothetical protein [Tenacibaculum]MCH3883294.1 hypothetical protein [Tenacibaculum aquimarinum]MDO6600350.1 hypothetical protein [Tenacibaculum sp. 1_MG-2023]
MIKLSDYMDYLNEEIVLARKKADEQAILIAKEYAKDPYLKYFRVPRFTMPSVKLNIPIKISELNSQTKYNFKMDDDAFISEVNDKIAIINKEKSLKINPINKETLKADDFKKVVTKLEKVDYSYVKKLDDNLTKVDIKAPIKNIVKKQGFSVANKELESEEMAIILKDAFKNRYTPVSAKLDDIYFDPNTSNETDKGKILLTLNVEMVEEGIRIHNATDEKGNKIEEIIFE